MPIIQAVTISNAYPNNCRWAVRTIENLREGQGFQLVLSTTDKAVATGLGKIRSSSVSIEREKDGKYSVILSFLVFEVRHMLEIGAGEGETEAVQSLATIKPKDRTAEAVLLWFQDPSAADPKVIEWIRQEIGQR